MIDTINIELEKENYFPVSDECPTLDGFARSATLPTVQGYKVRFQNPILECIADQTKYDIEWRHMIFKGSDILSDIIKSLQNGQIPWPEFAENISCDDWIVAMQNNPNFYIFQNCDLVEFQDFEDILLELASCFLKRTIRLIPFCPSESEMVFSENFQSETVTTYHLLHCDLLRHGNFFVSILPHVI